MQGCSPPARWIAAILLSALPIAGAIYFILPSDHHPATSVLSIPSESSEELQAATLWEKTVRSVSDPQTGKTTPALSGRVYLLKGSSPWPVTPEGELVVRLTDQTEKPKLMETWKLDSNALAKLVRKDRFGLHYSLSLPWRSYRAKVKRVSIAVEFRPREGSPASADSGTFTLDSQQRDAPKEESP